MESIVQNIELKNIRRDMDKKINRRAYRSISLIVMMLIMGIFLTSLASATEITTPASKTICENGTCQLALYSTTQYVQEDGTWKDYRDAKSLMGKGFNVTYLELDDNYKIEVKDFNATSITLDLKQWTLWGVDIPIKIWERNMTKEMEMEIKCLNESSLKDAEKDLCKVLSDSKLKIDEKTALIYKDLYELKEDKLDEVTFWDLGSKEVTYNLGMDKILEIGDNSTTITLTTADTENLDDTYGTQAGGDANKGNEATIEVKEGFWSMIGYLKFNISMIPTGATITNSNMSIYVAGRNFAGDTERMDATMYNLYNRTWTEHTVTYNNRPSLNANTYNTTPEYSILFRGNISTTYEIYYNWTTTQIVQWHLNNLSSTADFMLYSNYSVGLEAGDSLILNTKEATAGTRPILYITYNPLIISTINSPVDNYNSSSQTNNFNCSSQGTNLANVSIWTNSSGSWEVNKTESISGSTNSTILSVTMPDGDFLWTCQTCDTYGCNFATTNRTIHIDTVDPSFDITYPVNDTIYNVDVNELNWTYSDLHNGICKYSIDDVANTTVTCTNNHTDISILSGEHTIRMYVNDSFGNDAYDETTFTMDYDPPVITLNSPINALNSSTGSIDFNCTGSDNIDLVNVSFYLNDTLNETELAPINNTPIIFDKELEDGEYIWDCGGCDNAGLCANSTGTRTLTIDTTYPSVDNDNITDLIQTQSLPYNLIWTFDASDTNLDKCFYYTSDSATNISVTCNSAISTNWTTDGFKTITYCANDTAGNINCTTSDDIRVWYYTITNTANAYEIPEGYDLTISLKITSDDIGLEFEDTNATLTFYNETYDAPTKIIKQNYILFIQHVPIPDGYGSVNGTDYNFSWEYNVQDAYEVWLNEITANQTVSVYQFDIYDCDIDGDYTALNLTLKDENTNVELNASQVNTSIKVEFEVVGGSGVSWTFSKEWTNDTNVAICIPTGITDIYDYTVNVVAEYSADGYVTEFWYLDNGTLDNSGYFNSYTPIDISLLDLPTADSTTFLFTYTDEYGLQVDDAIVHTFRKYMGGGLFRESERSKQDNNGQTHVHLIEEDVIYYFMVTQYGNIIYTSDTYNAKCLSSPCSIELTGSASDVNWSIIDNEGGKYTVSSDKNTRIVTTTFNLDTSSNVSVSLYKFENGNATLINSSYLVASGGDIPLIVPLAYGNATFFVAISKDGEFVKSEWVDLTDRGQDYFGTAGALLGGLIVLSLLLMAVTEGAGAIIFTVLALIVIAIMKLIDLSWMALISIICAGGIIIWKLVNRGRKQG
jgi:hypothetical protein